MDLELQIPHPKARRFFDRDKNSFPKTTRTMVNMLEVEK
jgi:hypothetical protein